MATMTKVLPRQYELFLPSRPVYRGRFSKVKSLMDEITGAIIPIKGVTLMPVLTREGRKKVLKDLAAQTKHFNRRLNWMLRKHSLKAKGYFIGDVFTVHVSADNDMQAEAACLALKGLGVYGGEPNVEVVVTTKDKHRMYRVVKEEERKEGMFDEFECVGQMDLF